MGEAVTLVITKCPAYDLNTVLELAPTQINALVYFLKKQWQQELADLMYAVRTAYWAKAERFSQEIDKLEGKSTVGMKPGKQKISGFKVSVEKH